jgi:hypothetical protein
MPLLGNSHYDVIPAQAGIQGISAQDIFSRGGAETQRLILRNLSALSAYPDQVRGRL